MGKKLLFTIAIVMSALFNLSAEEWRIIDLDSISKNIDGQKAISVKDLAASYAADQDYDLSRSAKIMRPSRSNPTFKDVTLAQPGTLASALGDDVNEIDSLVVRGTVDDADIYTMWSSSFYGKLKILNLKHAEIKGGKLPKHAFWHQDEQYNFGDPYILCISLQRIILPDGLEEIGEGAFAYAIDLEDINFPSTLKSIKRRCFTDCISLKVNPIVFHEGLEEIGDFAFCNCRELNGKVVLPSTLKKIEAALFFSTKITECNFPEGLEEIGDAAFYETRLKEVVLPSTCTTLSGTSHFMYDSELEKVVLPDGLTYIPNSFVLGCTGLKEFRMPDSVEVIGRDALALCSSALYELHISSNLRHIGTQGIADCRRLTEIRFPATLETLEATSCEHLKDLKRIYCAAEVPPACIPSDYYPGFTPFGKYNDDFDLRTHQDIPVYVPVGTADLYRNAWGWDYFTNFIEIDEFPAAGIDYVATDGNKEDNIFDLFGRKVEKPVAGTVYIRNGKKFISK